MLVGDPDASDCAYVHAVDAAGNDDTLHADPDLQTLGQMMPTSVCCFQCAAAQCPPLVSQTVFTAATVDVRRVQSQVRPAVSQTSVDSLLASCCPQELCDVSA